MSSRPRLPTRCRPCGAGGPVLDPQHRTLLARRALTLLLATLVLCVGVAPVSDAAVPRQTPSSQASSPATSASAPAPGAEPEPVPGTTPAAAPAPANTPQPTGQPLPSKRQRVADSLVAAFLLVVLVGGVALGWYLSRRHRRGGRAAETPAATVAEH